MPLTDEEDRALEALFRGEEPKLRPGPNPATSNAPQDSNAPLGRFPGPPDPRLAEQRLLDLLTNAPTYETARKAGQWIGENPATVGGIIGGFLPNPVAGSALLGGLGAGLEGAGLRGMGLEAGIQGGIDIVGGRGVALAQKALAPAGKAALSEALPLAERMRGMSDLMQGVSRREEMLQPYMRAAKGTKTLGDMPWERESIGNASQSIFRGGTAAVRPDEITNARLNDFLFETAMRYQVGQDILLQGNQDRAWDQVTGIAAHLADTIGGSMARQTGLEGEEIGAQQLGKMIRGLISDKDDGFLTVAKAPAQSIYNGIADLAGGTTKQFTIRRGRVDPNAIPGVNAIEQPLRMGGARVDYNNIRKSPDVQEVLNQYVGQPQFSSGSPSLDTWVRRFMKDFAPVGPKRTARGQFTPKAEQLGNKNVLEALDDRNKLRAIRRDILNGYDPKASRDQSLRIIRRMEEHLTGEIKGGLRKYMPEAGLDQWLDVADKIYAGANRQYNNRVIARLMSFSDDGSQKTASNIIHKVINPGTGENAFRGQDLKRLREAFRRPGLGPKEARKIDPTWDRMREYYTSDLLWRAWDPVTKRPDGRKLGELLKKEDRAGRLGVMLGDNPKTIDVLNHIVDAEPALATGMKSALDPNLKRVKPKSFREATGSTLMGVPSLAQDGLKIILDALGPTEFASRIAGNLITSRRTAKLLSEGYRLGWKSKGGIRVMTKLQMAAVREMQTLQALENRHKKWLGAATAQAEADEEQRQIRSAGDASKSVGLSSPY